MSGTRWTVLITMTLASAAAAQEALFTVDKVTEQAIVDALRQPTSAEPTESDVTVRSRGFRPAVRTPAGGAALASAAERKSARASLLITFDVDSAVLLPPARAALDVVARALKSDALASQRFVIEGHADPRGDEEHNQRLSLERAQSVVDYLGSAHSVGAGRLQAVGLGSSRLINRAEPNAPENRRVTIARR